MEVILVSASTGREVAGVWCGEAKEYTILRMYGGIRFQLQTPEYLANMKHTALRLSRLILDDVA